MREGDAGYLLYFHALSPSSSGQGRHPFKVDITGSNPVGGTIDRSSLGIPLRTPGFLLPRAADSDPMGSRAVNLPIPHGRPGAPGKRREMVFLEKLPRSYLL